jgi:GH15 family glucan-1,4-alpha-glucosidase
LLHLATGLRLADKRSLPCPKRNEWIAARDELYEEIMLKAWNPELQCFGQSYEETSILDSAVLIMPLVFFIQPVRAYGLFQQINHSIKQSSV